MIGAPMRDVPEPNHSERRGVASTRRRARRLPAGTVTLLFTDVEGSTRHLHEVGAEQYAESLARHRRIVRRVCADEDGVEVDTQGDAFFVAFADASGAARAARAIANALDDGPMRVRIGLHTGRPLLREEGYVGEDVHLGARIAAAGHGGQVLLSRATREAIGDAIELTDLGEHRLKDIDPAVAIFQLGTGSFPPLKTITNTNLPRPADSFVGRNDQLTEIASRLRDGTRLLTLLGPGGTGKTRLALEAAATLVPDFKAGTFWVDLSPVRDPAAVAQTVAATLTTEQDVEAYIGEREMLLVLDNLEQVIDASPWIGSLVAACANARVLVTSRERLRVRGELVIQVPPLPPHHAVQLFADRSGLPPSGEVEQLCARLEHLPLAVELAAARASTLTPREMLGRLGQRLDMLKGGRDADPRQRTLRATIDWSHGLLTTGEQRLLQRLSVFAGGATLEAVEVVCHGDLGELESLVDKSLVRATDGRYTMLETVREYATEKLEASGDRRELRDRHAGFVENLMSTWVPELTTAGHEEIGRSLTLEFANLQAAFAWLVEAGDSGRATRLINTSWWFIGEWVSQTGAGLAMCEAVLAMPSVTDEARATLRHREGNFALQLADRDRARRAWSDAAEIARRIGDAQRESSVLHNLALTEADPMEAIRLFKLSVALAPPTAELARLQTRWNLAGLHRRAGDADEWEAICAEVLEWATRLGDYRFISSAEDALGDAALQRGDAPEAFERASRSVELSIARGHDQGVVIAETLRCRAALRLARSADAIESLARMVDLSARSDLLWDEEIAAAVLTAAAEVLAAAGEVERAVACEGVRRLIADRLPTTFADAQRLHEEWLTEHGVVPAEAPTELDVPAALSVVRDWLATR
jgi:predicted ATPase/class 3 adenylate cyclase